MKFQIFFIFNIICISAENLNYIKVLDHGGYYGYVCTPEAYGSVYFGKRLTECVYIRNCTTRGRDFAHFNDSFEKHPLVDNVENGTYLLCKLMCDKNDPGFFTFDQPLENGSNITRRLAYEYVKLSYKPYSWIINNGSYVSYEISNLDLISADRIKIVMTNTNVYTDNLTFYKNQIKFKVLVNEGIYYHLYEKTSVFVQYGTTWKCDCNYKFGPIILMKEDDPNCSSMRNGLLALKKELMNYKNESENNQKMIENLENQKSYWVRRKEPLIYKATHSHPLAILTNLTNQHKYLKDKLGKVQSNLISEIGKVRDLKKKLNVSNEKTLKLKKIQEKSLQIEKVKSTKSFLKSETITIILITVPCVILVISILLNIYLGYQIKRKPKIKRKVRRHNEHIVENVLL